MDLLDGDNVFGAVILGLVDQPVGALADVLELSIGVEGGLAETGLHEQLDFIIILAAHGP